MAKAIIVHGWDGAPAHGWYPWVKDELARCGYEALLPQMPHSSHPIIEEWVEAIEKAVGDTPLPDTIFIGHSLGCQAICRFLEKTQSVAGGVFFIAPVLSHISGLDEEEKETAHSWMTVLPSFAVVGTKARKFWALFSDNDPFIPTENQTVVRELLKGDVVVENNKGHYSEHDECFELPILLRAIAE